MMDTAQLRPFLRQLVFVALVCTALGPTGCETENPVEADEDFLRANLFPIAAGRILVFTTHELDANSGQKVDGTAHRDVTYIQAAVTYQGKSAFRLIDSVYTTQGTLERVDTYYVALQGDDLYFWEGDDVNAWYPLFKRSAGLNNEYIIQQFQEVEDGVTVNVTIKGKFSARESVTVPIGTVQAYKLEIKVAVSAGSLSSEWTDQFIYLADGYGPVRTTFPNRVLPGTTQSIPGEESLLVSKNF